MILYTETKIHCNITKENKHILDEFSINYENDVIKPQKIDLDEFDINTLFDEFFCYDEIHLEYGFFGGEGCCFSLCISQKN